LTAKQLKGAFAPDGSQYVTLTDGAGNLGSGASGGLTIGSSAITGGATTQVLFNLGGVVSSDTGFTYAGSGGTVTVTGSMNVAGVLTLASTGYFLRDGGSNSYFLGSGNKITWSSTTDGAGGSNDIGLARNAANILEVNTGTPGTFAALKVSGLTNSTTRNDTGYDYQTPTTGQTVTLSNTKYHTIIDPAGALAALTIAFPSAPTDGMMLDVKISTAITTLTLTSSGTIKGAPTSPTIAGLSFTAIYKVSNTTWYI